MNKLFGLFLLAFAFLAPDVAQAANRFLTCATTCTITAIDTSIWGTTTGGTGASVPGASDDVILDGATCVGGTTCTATMGAGYNPTWISVTQSACTASTAGCILDLSANNNNVTVTGSNCYTNTGAGTRTINMGSGTWTCSNNSAIYSINASLTYTQGASTIAFTGTGGTSSRRLTGGAGKTFNIVTVASGTSPFIPTSATITTLTVSAGNRVVLAEAATTTITTITNVAGSSSAQTLYASGNPTNGVATVSSANNWTCDWCGFQGVTFSGGGTFTATNSFDFKGNTSITITPPSGGGGGGRIIGG